MKEFKNILIHSSNWIGDTIMSVPLIKELRNTNPDSNITIIARKHIAPLFRGNGIIDNILYTPEGKGLALIKDEFRLRRELRTSNYDIAVLLPNSFISALRVFGLGIPLRIGYANECRSFMLTHKVYKTSDILEKHMSAYYMNILTLVGIHSQSIDNQIPLSDDMKKYAQKFIDDFFNKDKKVIALGIGSAQSKAKMWSIDYYIQLADILTQKYNFDIVLIDSPDRYEKSLTIGKQMKQMPIIPTGDLMFTACILSMCDAFIGNDSGAMHLASAVNIPIIGLYFSTDPKRNYPMGSKSRYIAKRIHCAYCGKPICKYNKYDCTRAIRPQEVIDLLCEEKIL